MDIEVVVILVVMWYILIFHTDVSTLRGVDESDWQVIHMYNV